MQGQDDIYFANFRVDLTDERLWHNNQHVSLTHKAFSLLRSLIAQPHHLVTKETLLAEVWPNTIVSEAVLANSISELRRALGDPARTPQFIETVHRRGYRFVADVSVGNTSSAFSSFTHSPNRSKSDPLLPKIEMDSELSDCPQWIKPQNISEQQSVINAATPIIGRDSELHQLEQWYRMSCQGHRQLCFITGEAGIGKTTLVNEFLRRVSQEASLWMGRGQCIDQYGAGEAYMPLLDALGGLCRGPNGTQLVTLLQKQAPSWLTQLPAQSQVEENETLYWQLRNTTQERMLRELTDAIESLTTDQTLLLVLEDLHWCDPSTLAWLAFMARRQDHARLFILATYRPTDVIVHHHPVHSLSHELHLHNQCQLVSLEYWTESEIDLFIAQQYEASRFPERCTQILYQRTSGNPLFVGAMVEEMDRRGMLRSDSDRSIEEWMLVIPDSLRQLIDQQLDSLSPENQALIEAASVAGATFSIATVETALEAPASQLEIRYEALARRQQFIRANGIETWPDGTVATSYCFRHTLHQEVVYTRISLGRRLKFHQQIGTRMEAGYGRQAREIASELASHFVHTHDISRAVRYLILAGENALQRSAFSPGVTHPLDSGVETLANVTGNTRAHKKRSRTAKYAGLSVEWRQRYDIPRC